MSRGPFGEAARYFAKTCTARQDGAYLITFRDGSVDRAAVSPDKINPGEAFILRDGSGSYPVAVSVHARQS